MAKLDKKKLCICKSHYSKLGPLNDCFDWAAESRFRIG